MKKLIVLFLSVILLLVAVPTVSVSAAKEPTFVVSSEKGKAGDTVKVTISTKNNPGIISMKLSVKYDSSALKLTDAKEGKFENVAFSSTDNNPFIVNWIDSLHPNNKTNGVVATLKFKILDTAPEGKSEISLSYDPDDVFEMTEANEFINVTFGTQSGYVDITNPDAGKKGTTNNTTSNTVSDASSSSDETVGEDTTGSQILEQIYQSAAQNANQSDETQPENSGNTSATDNEPTNSWIIWVVVAAVVLLGGVFAVVIIKSKK